MGRHLLRVLISLFAAITMVVVLVPDGAGAGADVGSVGNPVRLSATTEAGPAVQLLATALAEATGLEFVFENAGSDESAVGWMCITNRSTAMRIASSTEFVYAAGCGVDARLRLIRFGSSSYWSEFLVPQDSALDSLDDLSGLDWYYSDEGSTVSYMVPLGMLTMAGVTDQIPTKAGTHVRRCASGV